MKIQTSPEYLNELRNELTQLKSHYLCIGVIKDSNLEIEIIKFKEGTIIKSRITNPLYEIQKSIQDSIIQPTTINLTNAGIFKDADGSYKLRITHHNKVTYILKATGIKNKMELSLNATLSNIKQEYYDNALESLNMKEYLTRQDLQQTLEAIKQL